MTDSIHSAGIWKKEDDDKFFFYLHVFRQKQAPPQDHLSVIVLPWSTYSKRTKQVEKEKEKTWDTKKEDSKSAVWQEELPSLKVIRM